MPSQRYRSRLYNFWGILFLISLTTMLCLGPLPLNAWQVGPVEMATAHPAASQLVQQGIKIYQKGDFQAAIQLWQTALTAHQQSSDRSENEPTVLKYLIRAYQQVGRIDQSIAYSEQAVVYYRQMKNSQQLERMLTEQAQLYSSLGQQKRAIAILCGQNGVPACSKDSALEVARRQSDDTGEVAALGSLGNAYRLQGEYDQAVRYLEQSLEIANKIGNQVYISAAFDGLANTYSSLARRDTRRAQLASLAGDRRVEKFRQDAIADDGKAVQYFEDSLRLARVRGDQPSELRSLLSLILLYHHRQADSTLANDTIQQSLVVLEQLPDSRDKAYAAIKLADLIPVTVTTLDTEAAAVQCQPESSPKSVTLLNKAVVIAQRIQDRQAESFAFGRLGHLYECRQDYKQALIFTQQAQLASDANSLYLWEWQAGRIFRARGQMNEAINAYEGSIKTLKSIRGDLALASRELQFDFRDTVEPIYREAIELILDRALEQSSSLLDKEGKGNMQARLQAVLETVDDLRLAELQNYLGDDCTLSPIEKPVALVAQGTAVFSSIILKDRIAIILTLPDGEKKLKSQVHLVPIESQEVVKIINDLRFKLEDRSDLENTFKASSQQVYDWFIRPFISELDKKKIETLVFIQDGILRSIPTAALYDGKQFLVQKYAIANTPSLTLTNPTQLASKNLRVLAFGLTQSATVNTIDGQTFFGPLSQVKTELGSIKTVISDSKSLLDESFTSARLKQELEKNTYPIIHLATHGKFGFDAKETFLVTGQLGGLNNQNSSSQRYNEKLTIDELYQIITSTRQSDRPIELLTLSACETAVGSDRDALGIAGIALQAGSQSAMASLWEVDDQATAQLIAKFYRGLHEGLSRAKALQTAQKAWLEEHPDGFYSHPGYWAAFILVGNWL